MSAAEPTNNRQAGSAAADTSSTELISTELERVVRRWQQLPLERALSAAPNVRDVVQKFADEVAQHRGVPHRTVPDLGPVVLIDQLRVMVFDHQAAGLEKPDLACRLGDLRRSLP